MRGRAFLLFFSKSKADSFVNICRNKLSSVPVGCCVLKPMA